MSIHPMEQRPAERGREMGLALNLANRGGHDRSKPHAAGADESARERGRRSARVLVVDDEAPVRSMIGATLERQGYEVFLASSGSQAMELLEQNPFDLVLTDI